MVNLFLQFCTIHYRQAGKCVICTKNLKSTNPALRKANRFHFKPDRGSRDACNCQPFMEGVHTTKNVEALNCDDLSLSENVTFTVPVVLRYCCWVLLRSPLQHVTLLLASSAFTRYMPVLPLH